MLRLQQASLVRLERSHSKGPFKLVGQVAGGGILVQRGGKFVVEGRACFIHGFGGYMKLMVANHVHARL